MRFADTQRKMASRVKRQTTRLSKQLVPLLAAASGSDGFIAPLTALIAQYAVPRNPHATFYDRWQPLIRAVEAFPDAVKRERARLRPKPKRVVKKLPAAPGAAVAAPAPEPEPEPVAPLAPLPPPPAQVSTSSYCREGLFQLVSYRKELVDAWANRAVPPKLDDRKDVRVWPITGAEFVRAPQRVAAAAADAKADTKAAPPAGAAAAAGAAAVGLGPTPAPGFDAVDWRALFLQTLIRAVGPVHCTLSLDQALAAHAVGALLPEAKQRDDDDAPPPVGVAGAANDAVSRLLVQVLAGVRDWSSDERVTPLRDSYAFTHLLQTRVPPHDQSDRSYYAQRVDAHRKTHALYSEWLGAAEASARAAGRPVPERGASCMVLVEGRAVSAGAEVQWVAERWVFVTREGYLHLTVRDAE